MGGGLVSFCLTTSIPRSSSATSRIVSSAALSTLAMLLLPPLLPLQLPLLLHLYCMVLYNHILSSQFVFADQDSCGIRHP